MDSVSQNQKVQEGLLSNIQNRISVRKMYQDRGITTLGKAQDIRSLAQQIQKAIDEEKSDLEEYKKQSESNLNKQKDDNIFQNQGQLNKQTNLNLNAQHIVQKNPNPNFNSNNNAQGLFNQPTNNNQVQGNAQFNNEGSLAQQIQKAIDEEESKEINNLQIQIKQLNETIFLLKKQKSDLEEYKKQPESNLNKQKDDNIFQNQDQLNKQTNLSLNAQNIVQENPNPNFDSNNNAEGLFNLPKNNNQVQGNAQLQMNLLQQFQYCVKKYYHLIKIILNKLQNVKRMQKFK
ncbi:hypothetical protein ABPG72_019927 [Tetrahymena utriculariae]